ncbi:MAG: Tfp pilus assembly protein FimT/FimU, partial [Pseudobdellovibrionaceae bacterium]
MFRFVSNIFSRLNFGGILSHQRGFTLIEIVTTLAVLSAVTLTSGSVVMMSGKIQNSAMSRVQIDLFQRELIRHIQSDNSWERTLMGELNAHALDCLYHETACEVQGRAIENQRFAVYEPGGQLFYDGSSDNSGLTEKGEKCSAFSQEGNDSCPYQFRVMWSAVCQPGNCVKPQIKITTTFHYSPKNLKQNINPGAYSTTFFKDEGPEPASLDCEGHANGSTWSQFVDRVDPRACAPSGSTFDTYRTTTNFVCTNAVIYSSNSDALLSSGVCPAIPTNCGTYASGSTWTTFTDDSVSRPCPPSASTTDVYRTSTTFQCLAGVTTQVS